MKIKHNVRLAPYTTYKIGGKAKYFCEAKSEKDVLEAREWAHENSEPIFVLGGGSNILISDEGFNGLVVFLDIKGMQSSKSLNPQHACVLEVGAGENWDDVVKYAIDNNLQGIECLSGIPGTTGGALSQNIDAYGQIFADVFKNADVVDVITGECKTFTKNKCELGYHDSIFKQSSKRYIIIKVRLQLKNNPKPSRYKYYNRQYRDYRHSIGDNLPQNPTLHDVRNAVLDVRGKKGMLLAQDQKTVGSFFKNVIVTWYQFKEIKKIAQENDLDKEESLRPWFWDIGGGKYKVSAAFLLEYTGWQKGKKYGKAEISSKHVLSIVNPGNAKAEDILHVARDMQESVYEMFDVMLEPELNFVGFSKNILFTTGS